jgi:RimJ/RimL family protein N-acetyltransferase
MQIPLPTLEGSLVRLERLTEAHLAPLRRHAGDPEIWRYMPVPQSPELAFPAWVKRATEPVAQGTWVGFATIAKQHGEPVGGTCFIDISPLHRTLEIGGTWLAPEFWRSGINTEAKYLQLSHAFEVLNYNRVQLKTDARNLRSQAAIERLGARREGVLRAHLILPDGHVRDTVMYSIIASEWPAVKARLAGFLGAERPQSNRGS